MQGPISRLSRHSSESIGRDGRLPLFGRLGITVDAHVQAVIESEYRRRWGDQRTIGQQHTRISCRESKGTRNLVYVLWLTAGLIFRLIIIVGRKVKRKEYKQCRIQ